jgi:MoaA/NifB/PqqE/SkfB family radical SAM enzyme
VHASELDQLHKAALDRPLEEIAIELTVFCNLSCTMCSVWRGKRHGISSELVREILRQARSLGADRLTPCGAETFMRRDSLDLFYFAQSIGFRSINIVTNGLLLTPAKLDRLEGLPIARLNVSIDGQRDVHESLRGRGTFDRAMRVLGQLQIRRLSFGLSTVLMRPTLDDVERVLEIAASFGVREVSLQPYQPEIAYEKIDHDKFGFAPSDEGMLKRRISEIGAFAEGLGISVYTQELLRYVPEYLVHGKRPIPEGGCFIPSRFLLIDVHGDVYPCFFMQEKAIGNVHDTGLPELWHNDTQRALNRLALSERCPGCLAACSDVSTYRALARQRVSF